MNILESNRCATNAELAILALNLGILIKLVKLELGRHLLTVNKETGPSQKRNLCPNGLKDGVKITSEDKTNCGGRRPDQNITGCLERSIQLRSGNPVVSNPTLKRDEPLANKLRWIRFIFSVIFQKPTSPRLLFPTSLKLLISSPSSLSCPSPTYTPAHLPKALAGVRPHRERPGRFRSTPGVNVE